MDRRVVKFGGSLLDFDQAPACLRRWLAAQPSLATLFLAGGGGIVDEVRRLDRIHAFSTAWCHWLCVELLDQTAQVLAQLLPECELLATADGLEAWLARQTDPAVGGTLNAAIVSPRAFYSPATSSQLLPENWQITSDSISALLAQRVAAEELVLLKSTGAAELQLSGAQSDLHAWVAAGLVDPVFPEIAAHIPRIRCCNLRQQPGTC